MLVSFWFVGPSVKPSKHIGLYPLILVYIVGGWVAYSTTDYISEQDQTQAKHTEVSSHTNRRYLSSALQNERMANLKKAVARESETTTRYLKQKVSALTMENDVDIDENIMEKDLQLRRLKKSENSTHLDHFVGSFGSNKD